MTHNPLSVNSAWFEKSCTTFLSNSTYVNPLHISTETAGTEPISIPDPQTCYPLFVLHRMCREPVTTYTVHAAEGILSLILMYVNFCQFMTYVNKKLNFGHNSNNLWQCNFHIHYQASSLKHSKPAHCQLMEQNNQVGHSDWNPLCISQFSMFNLSNMTYVNSTYVNKKKEKSSFPND